MRVATILAVAASLATGTVATVDARQEVAAFWTSYPEDNCRVAGISKGAEEGCEYLPFPVRSLRVDYLRARCTCEINSCMTR